MQVVRRLSFPSETLSKRAFTEISNLVRRSNIQSRGRSFAASVPSDTPKLKKGRKRVTKDERKAMVDSFVNRYKAMNSGKFPTASNTKKEVGGCYYVIRGILQELEYKSKRSSINTRNETLLRKEVAKKNESSTEVVDVSSSAEIHKNAQTVRFNDVNTGDSSIKHFGVKEGPQTSILVEKTLLEEVAKPTETGENSKYVATQSHLLKEEAKDVLHPCPGKPEDNVKEKTPSEDMLDPDGPEPKTKQHQQLPKLEKFGGDLLSEKRADDEELQKKSSMWGNLKSLADGIIDIWRKL